MDLVSRVSLGSGGLAAATSARLIGAVLDTPVGVRTPRPQDAGASETLLLRAGPALADAWLWATTATADTPPGHGWVVDGMPILFMTLLAGESMDLPATVQHMACDLEAGERLQHFILVHRGREVRICLLHLTPESNLPRVFALEVCLKRLHVEMVCARMLLGRLGERGDAAAVLGPPAPADIAPEPRSEPSDHLQRNLLDISRRLRRLDRLATDLSPPGTPVHAGLVRPETNDAQRDTAIQRVDAALRRQDIRPNVAKSVGEVLHLMPGVLNAESADVQSLDSWRGDSAKASALSTESPDERRAGGAQDPGGTDHRHNPEPDTSSLQWNTGFPHDSAVEKARGVFVGVSYLLRTAIQAGQNTIGGLTPGEALRPPDDEHLEATDGGKKFFTVRFGLRLTGAVVKPAGSTQPPSSDAISDPLRCTVGDGTPPFDLDLIAVAAGPIGIELTLYVNGGAVLRRAVGLTAVDLKTSDRPAAGTALPGAGEGRLSSVPPDGSGGPISPTLSGPAPLSEAAAHPTASPQAQANLDAAALPVGVMLRRGPTAASLEVTFRDGKYWFRLVIDSAGTELVSMASGVEVLANTVIVQRNELIRLSNAYRVKPEQADDPLAGLHIREPPEVLLSFARIGARLHRALFGRRGDLAIPSPLRDMAATIARMGRGVPQSPRMQIDAEFLPVPWAVIYDGPEPDTADDVDLESFWGVRFKINRVARVTLAELPPDGAEAGERQVTACLNPNLDAEQKITVLQRQRTFFQGASVMGRLIESGADLREFLQTRVDQAPCNFLYFFCHATAAQTLDRNSFPDQSVPLDAATIELDKPPISVEQLCQIRIAPLPARPLIFMNTCSSAQGDSVFQSVFLTHFFGTWRASGFIGTDWTVPTVFADSFGRLFLKCLLIDRKPIAEAFYDAAREVLALRNPFPLIYALYVQPDYTL
jgi:hypothetical protein